MRLARPLFTCFRRLWAIVSGTDKATDFKFGQYIHRVEPNKSPLKVLEKRERGRIQGAGAVQIFWIPPIISGTDKAKNFKFCTHIQRINRNKSPLKIGKSSRGRSQLDSRNFSGHRYIT